MGKTRNKSSTKKTLDIQPIPWMPRIILSIFSFFLDAARRRDGTLNRRLLALFDVKWRADPVPRLGICTYDVVFDPSRGLGARLFLPSSPPSSATGYTVVVYFHGGGFALFSSSSKLYDDFCRRLACKLCVAIISVNFRRSPEHRFPAHYDDGLHVLRFLNATAGKGSTCVGMENLFQVADLHSCFIAGDSAGGNIAHHVARRWSTEETANANRAPQQHLRLAGLVAIQPFFGGEEKVDSEVRLEGAPMVNLERTNWFWKAFLPEGADRDHHASNVYGPGTKALEEEEELGEGFPPAAVVVGTADPLEDRQKLYAGGLRERGKEVKVVKFPAAIHGFFMFPEVPESGMLIEEMKGFIHKCCTKKESRED